MLSASSSRLASSSSFAPSLARALFSTTPSVSCKIEADRARKTPLPLIARKSGIDIIHDPLFNKGTGFTSPEKERMKLRGLVPPRNFPIEVQQQRILNRFHQKSTPLEKHSYLSSLQDRNETLFYRVLMDNIDEMAPIIYTPTVGDACINFGHEYRRARGMYVSAEDRGEMAAMLYNWPAEEVDVIVVTDGNRILGLGDLGAHGMGIPIGKLSLYVAAGGIHPTRVLPITIDVGTDNEALRNDPFYLGLPRPRIRGQEYFDIIEEFMQAVYHRWPKVLVQFEDFANHTALPILSKYRHKYLCFNDDIQGTGAVTVAGLLCALRALRQTPRDITKQRIVCVGAGSAGIGVCESIAYAMREEGLEEEEAYKRFWLLDANGLLSSERVSLHRSQRPFARSDMSDGTSIIDTIRAVKPTILLGLSGVGKVFTEEVIREMKKYCEVPIIFPLSNPTSRAECSFEDAVQWTDGQLLFASGSPFQPYEYKGKTFYPSQGNNMFVFPGIGLGAVVSKATSLTDRMFYLASKELALFVSDEDIRNGKVYPDITKIRLLSERIACNVVNEALTSGTARAPVSRSQSVEQQVHLATYYPEYQPLVEVDLD